METETTKKNTKKKVAKVVAEKKVSSELILGPRITEKGALGAEKGVYTFNVSSSANKTELKKAIKKMYNVVPVRINITQITPKVIFRRGKQGMKSGGKKAVVYLKKGEKIAFA